MKKVPQLLSESQEVGDEDDAEDVSGMHKKVVLVSISWPLCQQNVSRNDDGSIMKARSLDRFVPSYEERRCINSAAELIWIPVRGCLCWLALDSGFERERKHIPSLMYQRVLAGVPTMPCWFWRKKEEWCSHSLLTDTKSSESNNVDGILSPELQLDLLLHRDS